MRERGSESGRAECGMREREGEGEKSLVAVGRFGQIRSRGEVWTEEHTHTQRRASDRPNLVGRFGPRNTHTHSGGLP